MQRLFTFIVLLGAATAAFGRGVVVQPAQVGLVGAPGQTVGATIYVSSPKAKVENIRIEKADYSLGDDGNPKVVAKPHSRSAADWVEVDRAEFATESGTRIPLQVTARIPKTASGSYWCAVLVEARPDPAARKGLGVVVVPRVLIPVIVTVTGDVHTNVSMSQMEATRREDGTVEVRAVVENRGNGAVLLSGAFTLERTGEAAEEVAVFPQKPITSLPETKITISRTVEWKGPIDGLVMRGYFRYGTGARDAVEAEAPIHEVRSVKPAAAGSQNGVR